MNKIAVIAKSEYLRRITSKGFIIATFLAPLFLIGLVGAGVVVGMMTADGGAKTVAVLDETGRLGDALAEALPAGFTARPAEAPMDSLRAQVRRGDLDGYFVLPAGLLRGEGEAAYYSVGGGGISVQVQLREAVNDVVREARLEEVGATAAVRSVLEERIGVQMLAITDEGEAADATWLYSGIGYVMGFIIYIAVLIYGAIVMRGVIEEKSNRIVEVIASSARPFDLMMGKVLGIGAVGLTQFVLWAVLLAAGLFAAAPLLAGLVDPATVPDAAQQQEVAELAGLANLRLPPASLFVYFILFFLGGYLLYASLFAAVGSAVESESDAQSLQAPIMIPVILPAIFLPFIADNPDAPLSIILSLIPLFSPILMPVRAAATAVPFWQMAASLLLLVLGFVAVIWLAARIYRVGILMYGKKASFRDLARWVRTA